MSLIVYKGMADPAPSPAGDILMEEGVVVGEHPEVWNQCDLMGGENHDER